MHNIAIAMHLVVSLFIFTILIELYWYLIVILVCLFLMANDGERYFLCFIDICISF